MRETTKAKRRRKRSYLLKERAFVGKGIDIGSGNDILRKRWFKGITSIEPFDIQYGDAQYINKYRNEGSYDFVYSSNCLEDMNDPVEALKNWFALLKEGGYLVFTVPDEDLYEQEVFPSKWNPDHKWTFTIFKGKSWCTESINITDLLKNLENCRIMKIELIDTNYNYSVHSKDQTLGNAEAFIEVVVQKV